MQLIESIGIDHLLAKREAAIKAVSSAIESIAEVDRSLHRLIGESISSLSRDAQTSFFSQDFLVESRKAIDAGLWSKLLLESGVRSFMSSSARRDWDESIMRRSVPELTAENVAATFKDLYGRRLEMFTDGVVQVFRSLSWDYKTNSPFAFGPKLIVSGLWTDKGWYLNSTRCNTLDDLVRAMHILDGKPEPDARNGLYYRIGAAANSSTPDRLEDEYLRLRWFKKTGSCHVHFKRPDLVDEMNLVLGSRFPDAVATDVRNPSRQPPAAPPADWISLSEEALKGLRAFTPKGTCITGLPPLSRSAYEEVKELMLFLGSTWQGGDQWSMPEQGDEWFLRAVQTMVTKRAFPSHKDYGFFETSVNLSSWLVDLADVQPGMTALEPSAGRGRIARELLRKGAAVRAVEVLRMNVLALYRFDGLMVSEGDFLEMSFGDAKFDRIVMNPPFARHQDIAHVMKAYAHLREGGRLVAVMGAGVKSNSDRYSKDFRSFMEQVGGRFERLPEGSFKDSGTMVNTVVVVVDKPVPAQVDAVSFSQDLLRVAA